MRGRVGTKACELVKASWLTGSLTWASRRWYPTLSTICNLFGTSKGLPWKKSWSSNLHDLPRVAQMLPDVNASTISPLLSEASLVGSLRSAIEETDSLRSSAAYASVSWSSCRDFRDIVTPSHRWHFPKKAPREDQQRLNDVKRARRG